MATQKTKTTARASFAKRQLLRKDLFPSVRLGYEFASLVEETLLPNKMKKFTFGKKPRIK